VALIFFITTGEISLMSEHDSTLEILLKEYDALKSEQAQRIGFRDNLLYVTLSVFGGVISFAFSKDSQEKAYYALLILPWVSLILGWTYLVNDQKISAIGEYIKSKLAKRIGDISQTADNSQTYEFIFGWEKEHRCDLRRKRRKIEQLIIDLITFVVSGILAIGAFWVLVPHSSPYVKALAVIEGLLLLILGFEIFIYADLNVEEQGREQ
jgi:peptidoglycan/LPS O-acetylase OafA/YrhL